MKYYIEPRKRGIHYINKRGRLTGLVTTCARNCLLKHFIEKKIEGRTGVTLRRGRGRRQLLDDLKEKREYWESKEETLDRTVENSLWKRLWTFRKTGYEIYTHT